MYGVLMLRTLILNINLYSLANKVDFIACRTRIGQRRKIVYIRVYMMDIHKILLKFPTQRI